MLVMSRSIIKIDKTLMSVLREWDMTMLYSRIKRDRMTQYRCFCSSCIISVVPEATKSHKENVRFCCCSAKRPDPQCPSSSCEQLLENWQNDMFFPQSLLWLHSRRKYILGNLPKNAVEFVSRPKGNERDDPRKKLVNKGWTLYRCRTCKYVIYASKQQSAITEYYAQRSKPHDEIGGPKKSKEKQLIDFEVAIVVNLPIPPTAEMLVDLEHENVSSTWGLETYDEIFLKSIT